MLVRFKKTFLSADGELNGECNVSESLGGYVVKSGYAVAVKEEKAVKKSTKRK